MQVELALPKRLVVLEQEPTAALKADILALNGA